jgi:hypothetical protein
MLCSGRCKKSTRCTKISCKEFEVVNYTTKATTSFKWATTAFIYIRIG